MSSHVLFPSIHLWLASSIIERNAAISSSTETERFPNSLAFSSFAYLYASFHIRLLSS